MRAGAMTADVLKSRKLLYGLLAALLLIWCLARPTGERLRVGDATYLFPMDGWGFDSEHHVAKFVTQTVDKCDRSQQQFNCLSLIYSKWQNQQKWDFPYRQVWSVS